MSGIIASSTFTAIVGLGVTGLSVARYLAFQQKNFMLLDSRAQPPQLDVFSAEFPDVPVVTGALIADEAQEILLSAAEIIVSPGLPLADPAFAAALAADIPVLGDIGLFARDCQKPVVAITGSNAKSTVTTLVGEMLQACGQRTAVAGNIGLPALDVLRQDLTTDSFDVFVLELSSFQLETTPKLNAAVATVLNVSADHMDRYDSMQSYHAAKQRIYFGAKNVVYNRADVLTAPPIASGVNYLTFGRSAADKNGFGVAQYNNEPYVFFEFTPLLPVGTIRMAGAHNVENCLAALALVKAFGADLSKAQQVLTTFAGLPHRCQWVATINEVDYYNDSKGTNVGATLAALNGLTRLPNKLVVIAGGIGKGADFGPLLPSLRANARCVILIGRDAKLIADTIGDTAVTMFAVSMSEAVSLAQQVAEAGDAVLLSPACASLDMYRSFEARGDDFCQAVEALA